MTYATRQDFYDRLKPEAITNYERGIKSVEAATGTFLAPGHATQSGDALRLVGNDLPAGFSAFTLYYALPNGSDYFRLAASSGGSAVIPVDAGSGLMSYVVDMGASIDRELNRQGAKIDACLRKRGVALPLVGAQPDLADLEIDLSAWKMLLARGYQVNRETNPDQDYKVLYQMAEERLNDLCAEGGWLPPGIVVETISDAPSEAWDSNLRGWKDERYGEEGI